MQIVSAQEKARMVEKRQELFKLQIEVQERIRKAAALGDLSENAEYHFAKEENRNIQGQLAILEAKLKNGLPSDTSSAADASKPAAPTDADKANSAADADKAKKTGNGG